MSIEDDKWNLNREPTRRERVFGSIFAIVIFIAMSAFLYLSASYLLATDETTNQALLAFAVANLFFIGSAYLLWRVTFTRRQKASSFAITTTGYLIGCGSCFLLVLAAVGLGNTPYLASVGLTGVAGSALIIYQGKRHDHS